MALSPSRPISSFTVFLLFMVICIVGVGLAIVSEKRARVREQAIENLLFQRGQLLRRLDHAVEKYAGAHDGLVPADVSEVVASVWDQFAMDWEEAAKRESAELSRVLIVPNATDKRGRQSAWVLALLVPKQGFLSQDMICLKEGPTVKLGEDVYGYPSSATPNKVAEILGHEFVDAVYERSAHPAAISAEMLMRDESGSQEHVPHSP